MNVDSSIKSPFDPNAPFVVQQKEGQEARIVRLDEKGNVVQVFNARVGAEKIVDPAALQKIADLQNKYIPKYAFDQIQKVKFKENRVTALLTTGKKEKIAYLAEDRQIVKNVATSIKTQKVGVAVLSQPAATSSRYDPVALAKRLLEKYGNAHTIRTAIENLQKSDIRFTGTHPYFQLDEKFQTLLEQLTGGSPEEISPEEISPEKMAKLQAEIATDLVGLVTRKELEADPIKDGTYLCQKSGHIENSTFQQDGKTISSLLQKSEKDVAEIANHAVIVLKDQHGKSDEVVVSRSSRTDTTQKIRDKSRADIQLRLESQSKKGLVKRDGYYEYQRVDTTFMDTNLFKSLATTFRSGVRNLKAAVTGQKLSPVENERKFIQNKRKAVEELWKGAKSDERGRYIEHTFINGEKVREYEPLVTNFVFSGQANKSENIARARRENCKHAQLLFMRILQNRMPDSRCLQAKNSDELASYIREDIARVSDPNLKSAFRAMLVHLTGKDEKGTNYDTTDGSDQQFLLFKLLADLAEVAFTVECKSGNDRSLTGVGLVCAAKEWEKSHGQQLYDPTQYTSKDQEYKDFAFGFTSYVVAFGPQNLLAARGAGSDGKPDLKTGKSPVFNKYADSAVVDRTFNILGKKAKAS